MRKLSKAKVEYFNYKYKSMHSYLNIRNTNNEMSSTAIWQATGVTALGDSGIGACIHSPVEENWA